MITETKEFLTGVLEDKAIGGIEKSLAVRSLEELGLEALGREVLETDFSLPHKQREALGDLVTTLAARRARNEKHLKARMARIQTLSYRTPITK